MHKKATCILNFIVDKIRYRPNCVRAHDDVCFSHTAVADFLLIRLNHFNNHGSIMNVVDRLWLLFSWQFQAISVLIKFALFE